jgi:murein DD-endopeptidase MepM/ murein hydrolase activator NlpD
MLSSWPPSHEPDYPSTSGGDLGAARSAFLVLLGSALVVLAVAAATMPPTPAGADEDPLSGLTARHLLIPVKGFPRKALRDTFDEKRGVRPHEALDIMAPKGTPVVAVDDGRVAKLFHSALGGITIYQFDPTEHFTYYYAHLDHYASGLVEGANVKRGEVIGFVGTTGNAPKNAPHLHFTVFRLGSDKRWWTGKAVNSYAFLNEQ